MSLMVAGKKAAKAIGSVMFDELDDWKRVWLKPGTTPYCDMDNKVIASPPFGFLDKKQDAVVRCCDIHETAHAILSEPISKMVTYIKKKGEEKTLGLLKEVVNCIEDRRIEAWAGTKWAGAGPSLREGNRIMASEWNTNMSNPQYVKQVGDLRQALIYLSFKDINISINWTPSQKAQEYIDLIGDKFHSWRGFSDMNKRKGFWNIVELSREILELLIDKAKEDKQNEQGDGDSSESGEQQKQQQGQGQSQSQESGEQQESEGAPNSDVDQELEDLANDEESEESEEEGNSGSDENEEAEESDDSKNSKGSDEDDEDGEDSEDEGEEDEEDGDTSSSSDSSDDSEGDEESDSSEDSEGENTDEDSEYERDEDSSASKNDVSDDEALEGLEEELGGENLSDTLERLTSDISQDSWEDDDDHYVSDTTNDEWRVPAENSTRFENARKEITCSVSKLTKYIENALQAVARSRKFNDRDRGRLDKKKLHQVAKSLSKKVFYKVRDGKKLNTCVSIVIDESGSMCGEQEAQVRCLAIALGECLTKLNIPFEIAGFSTTGNIPSTPSWITRSNPMICKLYKTFNETYQAVRTRLGSISNYNNHVDGEALEMMAFRMRGRREKRKVILALSDGEPYAGQGDSRLFERNLIRVTKKLRSSGIEVYGFGIDTRCPEHYYGKENFVYLNSVNDMGVPFFSKLYEIIGKGAR